ncbi:hypothetical protein BELL_0103g00110 [Botrytis elliptica]|uniref:Uncharacterized protein n=1 Tax=Botrytis elliptica TaxID=278938 RepID=A0A4Z1JVN8_9HELO|nr:hypothetical protein EAE99_002643 [Botrytis elliptica]TGO77516.1 hypothetical protein BELL_0103g00110 [Botrytis elliptica]
MPQVTLDYCIVQAAAANLSVDTKTFDLLLLHWAIFNFAAPQWPPVETEVNDGTLTASNVACTTAEDCLFMDIHVPANTTVKKLPVLQWTYGARANKSHTTPEGIYDLSNNSSLSPTITEIALPVLLTDQPSLTEEAPPMLPFVIQNKPTYEEEFYAGHYNWTGP